jgi:hypothetical protein
MNRIWVSGFLQEDWTRGKYVFVEFQIECTECSSITTLNRFHPRYLAKPYKCWSCSHTGMKMPDRGQTWRDSISSTLTGTKQSEETRKKKSLAKKGKARTAAHFEAMYNAGHWVRPEDQANYQMYRNAVRRYTNRSVKLIDRIDLRGADFHVDHRFSMKRGFDEGIVPWIIGSHVNLEVIPAKENTRKLDRCSITKEELYELYEGR